MRYTTIIDITEFPQVFNNQNACRLYLYMCLKAGYHDNDRDLLDISIRRLALQANLSLSATRHALAVLERHHLLTRIGTVFQITKWVQAQEISSRPKTVRQQKAIDAAAARARDQEEKERAEAVDKQRRLALQSQGKTSFMLYYESKLAAAEAGDEEARKIVEKNKATYEEHKQEIQKKK